MAMYGAASSEVSGFFSHLASLFFIWGSFKQFLPRPFVDSFWNKAMAYFKPEISIKFYENFNGRDCIKRNEAYTAVDTYLRMNVSESGSPSQGPFSNGVIRYYKLTYNRKYHKIITEKYLHYKAGKSSPEESKGSCSQIILTVNGLIVFEHPGTFQTLAMDPKKKEEIINDLINFTNRKEYYAKIGKAWRRGYLLYGPPGTGKSTMIAAMANFLDYDIYNIELTAIKDNTELRMMLSETTNRSIIVIEDIDCSLELTGSRKKKKREEGKGGESKVTLSGILNFIDGLASACGEEKIIVFTTNHIEKLDPALIRRGRMDKHIELSYCKFEAFKVLAKNYLDIDSHPLFEKINHLLEEVNISPADVAENLMPKTEVGGTDASLESLIQALETVREEKTLGKGGTQDKECREQESE
ncbi:aaa-atpase [Quercus suber]|uniref:Aaa-atpase n=1 Tax=Quercus suber TaxID=58331 RepID=A0AAW0MCB6_QUESU